MLQGSHPVGLVAVCRMGLASIVCQLEVLVKVQVDLLGCCPHLILVLFWQHARPAETASIVKQCTAR